MLHVSIGVARGGPKGPWPSPENINQITNYCKQNKSLKLLAPLVYLSLLTSNSCVGGGREIGRGFTNSYASKFYKHRQTP